ncbi:hypothetical protein DB32_001599 [Sandaracinus amylolyticus]|uniref:Uncharacterized protein n=1 Tax=Sandaracinus amylolyticus TaxID=927083 RepID=A0A0F6W0L5_9BACT|nr:hypothetical protein DB32_001599 [Sandaracinus amylolyticus]
MFPEQRVSPSFVPREDRLEQPGRDVSSLRRSQHRAGGALADTLDPARDAHIGVRRRRVFGRIHPRRV